MRKLKICLQDYLSLKLAVGVPAIKSVFALAEGRKNDECCTLSFYAPGVNSTSNFSL